MTCELNFKVHGGALRLIEGYFLAGACIAIMLLLMLPPAFAQRTTGTLRGQILDPTNAAVPNSQVTATNQDTGVAVKISATSAGTYNFPSLLPGKYMVVIEAAGFKNAILAKDAPTKAEDPEWSPEDARYSVTRWLPSTLPSWRLRSKVRASFSGESLPVISGSWETSSRKMRSFCQAFIACFCTRR